MAACYWVLLFSLFSSASVNAQPAISLSTPVWVIPPQGVSPLSKLSKLVQPKRSTNNVGISYWQGRLYLAFRTADHHHPQPPANASWFLRLKVDRALKAAGITEGLAPFLTETVESPSTLMYVLSAPVSTWALENLSEITLSQLDWKLEFEVHQLLEAIFKPYLSEKSGELEKLLKFYFGEEEEKRVMEFLKKDPKKAASLLQNADFREPLFLPMNGKLFFYFVSIEGEPLKFNPLRTWTLQKDQNGAWSKISPVLQTKELLWDVRPGPDGLAYAASYRGDHYQSDFEGATEVYFKKSKDGMTWLPAGKNAVVYHGGANEAGFEFDRQGNLWAAMRLDDGDGDKGWGSLVAFAGKDDLGQWIFSDKADPRRYDSPRMFRSGDELFLLARQNVIPGIADNAPFDLNFLGVPEAEGLKNREALLKSIREGKEGNKVPSLVGILADALGLRRWWSHRYPVGVFHTYEFTYWGKYAKRTALYRLNQKERRLEFLVSLPSAGDTAFPSVVQTSPGHYLIANYSSPFEQKDLTWGLGQKNRTGIYLLNLSIE